MYSTKNYSQYFVKYFVIHQYSADSDLYSTIMSYWQ